MTVTDAFLTREPSFAANAWSYSRLVTRAARDRSSSVAAPSPAPSSSTCSPSSEPCRIHGRSCRRVTYRQNDDPQNHVSNRFIDSSEDFEGSTLPRARRLSEAMYGFGGAKKRIDRRCRTKDSRADERVH